VSVIAKARAVESCVRRQWRWVVVGGAGGGVVGGGSDGGDGGAKASVSGGGGVLGPNTATRTLDFQGTRDTLQRTSLASSTDPRW
jgi:hypothetical protein